MGKKEEFLKKVENNTLTGEDLFLVLDVIVEMSESNEDIAELLEDLKDEGENFVINFKVGDKNAALIINDGKVSAMRELHPEPTLTITMDEDTALDILKGNLPVTDAYKEGKIKAEGELMKAAALGLMLNIVGDELNIL